MFDYNLKSLSPQGWLPCTREIFDELTHREDVKAICLELRQLYDQYDEGRLLKSTFYDRKGQLKKRLPAFAFHAHFPDGKRANKTALPSGLCMIDIDNLADPHELWADILSNALPLRVGAPLAGARTAQRAVPPHDDDIHEQASSANPLRDAEPLPVADTHDHAAHDHAAHDHATHDLAAPANPSAMLGTPPNRGEVEGGFLLSHITPSGHGLRLVLRIDETLRQYPADQAIIRMQQLVREWFISVLGKDPGIDLACKDLARISFAVPDSYILYLNPALFENEELRMKNEECPTANDPSNAADRDASPLRVGATLAVARTAHQGGNDTNDHDLRDVPSRRATARVAPTSNGNAAPNDNDIHEQAPSANPSASLGTPPNRGEMEGGFSFKGMPYASIIDTYWDVMGGPPADGERNTKLHQLAYHLRYICDFNADMLQKIMPTFGLSDKEMHDLIQSALKAPRYSYSNVMNKVLAKMQLDNEPASPLAQSHSSLFTLHSSLENDDDPPAMPTDLPPLVELLTSCSPDAYKPAVAHGIFPPLATHLRDVRFRYIDNVEHEATLMCLLMAGSSAGKSCLAMPIRYLMADIRQRDDENLLREKLWKKECTSLGANQDKPPRPEGLIIQEIDPDITNPAFVQRMKEAEPSPLYACMNEVEQFDNLRSSRGSKAQFQIMCYAFDPGNRYGQTRVGVNSVTEKVCVRFNWNASTTINKGQRYFKSVVNDGPLSRINVCTIPPAPIGDQMPVYGIYPDDFAQQLQPYLDNLCRAHGLLLIPEATHFAWRLVDRNAQTSALTQNPVFEHLSFRAAVIAWLKACVLYVAHGNQWDERIEQFCQWSMDYDLWCKMRFFSQAIEEAMRNEVVTPWRKDNLLNMLKDSFTKSDIKQLLRINGCKSSPAKILYIWEHRHFIRQNDDGTYSKVLSEE